MLLRSSTTIARRPSSSTAIGMKVSGRGQSKIGPADSGFRALIRPFDNRNRVFAVPDSWRDWNGGTVP